MAADEGQQTDLKANAQPEPPVEYFKNLLRWGDWVKVRQYFQTRRAVLDGENLVDLSIEQIQVRGFMGPLTFNMWQTTLAAVPGIAVGWLVAVLFANHAEQPLVNMPGMTSEMTAEIASIESAIDRFLVPFQVPFSALCLASLAAWGALYSMDQSKTARRRGRDA